MNHRRKRRMTREEFLYSPESLPADRMFEEIDYLNESGVRNIAERMNLNKETMNKTALRHGRPDIPEILGRQ